MPKFSVEISETTRSFEAPVKPTEPTPEVRHVYWEGEAVDEDAAKEAGYAAWGEKYGADRQPVGAIVKITRLD
jgi:hypothetical protein